MKRMKLKKYLFVMTAMASTCGCLLLSGCSNEAQEVNNTSTAQAAATVAPTAETTVAPTTETTVAPTAEVTVAPTTEVTDTYKAGTLTADEYKSEYIGIQFKATDKYKLATKEQMEAAFGAGAKVAYGDKSDQVQELSKDTLTYEMMASSATGYPNVNIGVQKSLVPGMTEEAYMEAFEQQLSALGTMDAKLGEGKEGDFCGEKYLITPVTVTVNGIQVQERVYLRKKDENFIFITVTGSVGGEKEMDDLVANFTPVK